MKVLLRVVLIVLVAVAGLLVGIRLTPRLTRVASRPDAPSALGAIPGRATHSDWGGGQLSFADAPAGSVIESVKLASGKDTLRLQTYAGSEGGVVLQQKPTGDYALTLALPCPDRPGRCGVFSLPSTNRFQKELLPGPQDAERPAPDIPLYPRSVCRTQVGRGTNCFVGFYLTPDSVEAVRSFYVRLLGKLGWQRVATRKPGPVETFAKNSEDRMVVVQLRRQDPATTRIGVVAMTSGRAGRRERR